MCIPLVTREVQIKTRRHYVLPNSKNQKLSNIKGIRLCGTSIHYGKSISWHSHPDSLLKFSMQVQGWGVGGVELSKTVRKV